MVASKKIVEAWSSAERDMEKALAAPAPARDRPKRKRKKPTKKRARKATRDHSRKASKKKTTRKTAKKRTAKRDPARKKSRSTKRKSPKRKATKRRAGRDDSRVKGKPDSLRVNINQAWEVKYWTKKFGVSADRLASAVMAALPTPTVDRVRAALGASRDHVGRKPAKRRKKARRDGSGSSYTSSTPKAASRNGMSTRTPAQKAAFAKMIAARGKNGGARKRGPSRGGGRASSPRSNGKAYRDVMRRYGYSS